MAKLFDSGGRGGVYILLGYNGEFLKNNCVRLNDGDNGNRKCSFLFFRFNDL